ncbi:DedA family protein [Azospirillum sp.]|uniref:DedA family protein n=1 Tax=Azospirillum sp. TaxID=34012 RepID=UPI003D731139
MLGFYHYDLTSLLESYGYWAVTLLIGVESTGIPVPGETMLLTAAIFAGTTHRLDIGLVIAAASVGAVAGDNIGYWAGREFGYRLLLRHGKRVGLNQSRIRLGRYLFLRHGGKVVFWGRFVAVLRTWAAFLAGANGMPWSSFLLFNCAGGVIWATVFGLGGYLLGDAFHRFVGPASTLVMVIAGIAIAAAVLFLKHREKQWLAKAEAALPGPLDTAE